LVTVSGNHVSKTDLLTRRHMENHADLTDISAMPHRATVITGGVVAVVMAGAVWSNLLSGGHQPFDRVAAPEPLKIERVQPERTAAATSNSYPSSSVAVRLPEQHDGLVRSDDPLAQLIMQTGSISQVTVPGDASHSGEESLAVTAQRALGDLGYYHGPADGLVGPQYEDAVRNYQASNGLPVTGVMTRPVLDHLQMTVVVKSAAGTDPVIHQVQKGLAELGYSPGSADGRMGEETRHAIRIFEADRGWDVTGEISDKLLAELGSTGGIASVLEN
jgi:peptidoglycan hydrolase-like protein with peptidoglycan-binding domain